MRGRAPWEVVDLALVLSTTAALALLPALAGSAVAVALGYDVADLAAIPLGILVTAAVSLLGLALCIAVHVCLIRGRGISWRELGVRSVGARALVEAAGACLLLALGYVAIAIVVVVISGGPPEPARTGGNDWLAGAVVAIAAEAGEPARGVPWIVLSVVLLGPLVEELVFRGLVLRYLRARMGRGWAIALSSAVFACIHVAPIAVAATFVLGLVCATLAERHGSLAPAALVHMANNAAVVAAVLWPAG